LKWKKKSSFPSRIKPNYSPGLTDELMKAVTALTDELMKAVTALTDELMKAQ